MSLSGSVLYAFSPSYYVLSPPRPPPSDAGHECQSNKEDIILGPHRKYKYIILSYLL